MALRFPKSENLKSRKAIKKLFEQGDSFTSFPVKLIYSRNINQEATKAAFAVPKRNFKLAVRRNHVKRQMREAYRLHKHLLTNNATVGFSLLFLCLGKEKVSYEKLETAFIILLKRLEKETPL